jgi:predicted HAD superfamily hydrolase
MGYRLAKNDNGLFEEKEVILISDLVAEKFIKSLWSKMSDKDINRPTIFAAYTRLLKRKQFLFAAVHMLEKWM